MRIYKSLGICLIILLVALLCLRAFVRLQKYDLSISGKIYAVNKRDSSLTAFDLEKANHIKQLFLKFQPREIVALPDENTLAIANYGDHKIPGASISLIDVSTTSITKTIPLQSGSKPFGVIRLRNENKVLVATNGGDNLVIIDLDENNGQIVIPTKLRVSHLLVLHPYLPFVYVTHKKSGAVSVINYDSYEVITTIKCGTRADGIDITPDGKELWVTNPLDNTISVIDTELNQVIDTIANGRESLRLRFTLDGTKCFATNALDGTINIFDRYTRKKIKTIVLSGIANLWQRFLYKTPRPVGILMHPEERYVFITNSNADKIEIINLSSLEWVGNISTGRVPDGLAFVQD